MKNLSNFEVVEMNHEEMNTTDGGCFMWFAIAAGVGLLIGLINGAINKQ